MADLPPQSPETVAQGCPCCSGDGKKVNGTGVFQNIKSL